MPQTLLSVALLGYIAIFRAPGFPTIDAPPISQSVLDEALAGMNVEALDDLRRLQRHSLLVLPYGSAFPLEAWSEIRDFVKNGGNLVVLGGAPFHQPVLRTPDGWRRGVRQPTFAHELLIGPAEAVKMSGQTVWELTVRLGTRAETPGEWGAEAPRDAVVRPLVQLTDGEGIPRACPLVEIDARGRWIFATSDAPLDAAAIRMIVTRALEGPSDLDARPIHASVEIGEIPRIRIKAQSDATRADLVVRDDKGRQVHRVSIPLSDTAEIRAQLAPGLYHVEVTTNTTRHPNSVTTGFWVRDAKLLAAAPRMTVSRDWMRRDGKVFPIVGTTYMASDVHRKFLFEPNPHVWDRDFALMQRLGINFVRTGMWMGWSRATDEAFLRAIDAYVQTAAKHGIIVSFTFFAFLPQSYGGSNPYLDPRALEGQRAFVSTIARRFRGVGWIQYDLINEPSYAPPEGLWSNRPIRDEWERRAWADWVRARHGEDRSLLRNRWQDPSDDVLELPKDDELWYSQVREDRRPRKAYDFVLFSQDVVAGWARKLRDALREAGGDPLVTVGQDEGGTGVRPSQQLHADSVDYTSVHPWWQNDDVLSTGVMTKVPEKPLLFQETGLMRLEDVNGFPWRSPDLAASVLDRKFAYAFASRACGAVEWAWNINPYMPIDNESTIGFFRPDGTAKPELDVVPKFAAFFRDAAPWLDDFAPDPVVIVIPQSRLFMNRPAATDGFRRAIRVLAERFGIVPTAISDLRLTPERLRSARLVIVPSVEFLDRRAAEALLAAPKVLFTGAVVSDPYGEVPDALQKLNIVDAGQPVQFREMSRFGWATFDRNLQEGLLRSNAPATPWHEPLPLEHAREEEPFASLLRDALAAAGVQTNPSNDGVALRVLEAPRSLLVIAVNETAQDAKRRVNIAGHEIDISVLAGRSRLVLFDRATGSEITRR
ncbi:MAG TPA: hypothetical protein VGS96_19335 [Thermoanaerobaculia bacterium]|nr:hypothetical protein [Thermoanaerobaculia bacterium]